MLKRLLISWVGIALLLTLLPAAASAAKGSVQVKIANFPVKVNGQLINNKLSKYPFIVYKDITYLPTNWDMFLELELSANWSAAKGLQVYRDSQNGVKAAANKKPYPQNLTVKNSTSSTYSAKISTNKIEIAYEKIDNNKEPYPFLEFRNVIYVPLTWKFAHIKLKMDLQWTQKDGLSLWGGQDKLLSDIIYDDEENLYAYTTGQQVLQISKSLKTPPKRIDKDQAKAIIDKVTTADLAPRDGGKEVIVDRVGNMLAYQGLELGSLTESEITDNREADIKINGTLFDIDDQRKLLFVKVFFPMAYGASLRLLPSRNQLFVIVDGKLNKIMDVENDYWLPRVLKNADGTVWITHDRVMTMGGSFYIPGTGFLALMDLAGNVRMANDEWNEMDVSSIGLDNLSLDSSHMVVRLYGKPKSDKNGKLNYEIGIENSYHSESDGLYSVDTALGLKRISNAPDVNEEIMLYKDNKGEVYSVNLYSNTVTNWTINQFKTWSDVEILKSLSVK